MYKRRSIKSGVVFNHLNPTIAPEVFSAEHQQIQTQTNQYQFLGAGRNQDIGGPFESIKTEVDLLNSGRVFDFTYRRNPFRLMVMPLGWEQKNALTMDINSSNQTSTVYESTRDKLVAAGAPAPVQLSELNSVGATAVARVSPVNPVVNLSTSIAEVISAKKLFSIPGRGNSLSGEYLNYSFGIEPTISDIKGIYEAATEQETILQQHERDSGRLIRRRYAFPVEEEVVHEDKLLHPIVIGTEPPAGGTNPLRFRATYTTTREFWFSGAFTYFLPKSGWRRSLSEMQRLYGVKPGLETAWNVIPFSFAADYFANMGDVLKNVDMFARDGLVMPYGYVMCRQKRRVTGQVHGQYLVNNPEVVTLRASMTHTTLQRSPANPFGFGVLPGDLSPRQMSLLAAIGLNRR